MKSKPLPENFAVFILTHGRPNNVITYKTLQKCGYTGKLFFIVDNEDKTADQYISNFGQDRVIIFDKKAEADNCDEGNNFDERRGIIMARNACFSIAESLGITYFLELDDDYTAFDYRVIHNGKGRVKATKDINKVINNFLNFYQSSNFLTIAFAQGGDFIGAIDNGKDTYRFSKRKCMNSFFCSTKRPFRFVGTMNEDVNTYTSMGSRGNLFFTFPTFSLTQKQTQSQKGGITDLYLRFGTYCKGFTTVMMHPSSVKVAMMQSNNPRLHHTINWKTTVPQIIRETHKKELNRNAEALQ